MFTINNPATEFITRTSSTIDCSTLYLEARTDLSRRTSILSLCKECNLIESIVRRLWTIDTRSNRNAIHWALIMFQMSGQMNNATDNRWTHYGQKVLLNSSQLTRHTESSGLWYHKNLENYSWNKMNKWRFKHSSKFSTPLQWWLFLVENVCENNAQSPSAKWIIHLVVAKLDPTNDKCYRIF